MNHLIFCSHNGQATLPQMIASLRALDLSADVWHITAVDNASSDDTLQILREAKRHLPMTVLQNPAKGKNTGLNLALDNLGQCGSNLIVFTDDDIIADSEWLDALVTDAQENPGATMFGGVVSPIWPMPVPGWLASLEGNFDVLYAQTHELSGFCDAHHIYGPNMAVRANLFEDGLRFDARIGPAQSSTYRMGSETELVQRLEHQGHHAWFSPNARVHHQVREHQLRAEFVFGRARRHGLGKGEFASRGAGHSGLVKFCPMAFRLVASEIKAGITYLPLFSQRRHRVLYSREWLRGWVQGYVEGHFGAVR